MYSYNSSHIFFVFFFSSRRRHTRCYRDWSSDVCSSDLATVVSGAIARGLAGAVLRVQVPERSMAGARRARYDALVAGARRTGAGGIAVAHTATDQAETMLDRLVRGAGTRGLAAMAGERRIDGDLVLLRPLLAVARDQVEGYVQARG